MLSPSQRRVQVPDHGGDAPPRHCPVARRGRLSWKAFRIAASAGVVDTGRCTHQRPRGGRPVAEIKAQRLEVLIALPLRLIAPMNGVIDLRRRSGLRSPAVQLCYRDCPSHRQAGRQCNHFREQPESVEASRITVAPLQHRPRARGDSCRRHDRPSHVLACRLHKARRAPQGGGPFVRFHHTGVQHLLLDGKAEAERAVVFTQCEREVTAGRMPPPREWGSGWVALRRSAMIRTPTGSSTTSSSPSWKPTSCAAGFATWRACWPATHPAPRRQLGTRSGASSGKPH